MYKKIRIVGVRPNLETPWYSDTENGKNSIDFFSIWGWLYANALQQTQIGTTEELEWGVEFVVPSEKYDEYMESYHIVPGQEEYDASVGIETTTTVTDVNE